MFATFNWVKAKVVAIMLKLSSIDAANPPEESFANKWGKTVTEKVFVLRISSESCIKV